MPAGRSPADAAVAAGIGHLDPDGSVVFEPPADRTDHAPVQRALTDTAPAPAAATPSDDAGTAPDADRREMDPLQVEALADRLLDPLLARIRAELWVDRERAGLLTEPWR
jgi:hypothetical protein